MAQVNHLSTAHNTFLTGFSYRLFLRAFLLVVSAGGYD